MNKLTNTFENEITADLIDQDAEMEVSAGSSMACRVEEAPRCKKVWPESRTLLWRSRCGGENICQQYYLSTNYMGGKVIGHGNFEQMTSII